MLKGLEISEVRLSEIDLGDRVDAEFYTKENLTLESTLKNLGADELREYGEFVASAFYPAATELYAVGDLPFVRCVDAISHPIITADQDSDFEKIPNAFALENKGVSLLDKGDIVITKVGTPCFASIVDDYDSVALSRTVMGIHGIKRIDPYYLMIYLRSKYGFQQLMRHREQTIQFQLTLERIKRVLVYRASDEFQEKIKGLVGQVVAAERLAKDLFDKAELTLLSELGFSGWQPPTKTVSVRKCSDFRAAGRFDAEYFQPKYDELLKKLEAVSARPLGGENGLATFYKSEEPGSECYGDEGVPFVRIADFSEAGIGSVAVRIPPEVCAECRRPKKDTILLSKDGSVGIAYKVEEDLDMVTSGGILHLTVTDSSVLPDYLTLVLNSKIGRMQAERDAGGSIIQHWKPSEIAKVVIPILPMAKQMAIVKKVQASFAARKESKRLLELAKRTVEVAIESSEQEGLDLISGATGIFN